MFSKYVPGATSTVSPGWAAVMAAWIVAWSAGTWMVVCAFAACMQTTHKNTSARTKVDAHDGKPWFLVIISPNRLE